MKGDFYHPQFIAFGLRVSKLSLSFLPASEIKSHFLYWVHENITIMMDDCGDFIIAVRVQYNFKLLVCFSIGL